MTRPGFLDWPDCLNARDLGGLPLGGGARVRRGALVRSDNFDRLTPAGVAAVRAAGVSRIVDIRTPGECERYPSAFATDPLRRNHPVNVADEPYDTTLDLASLYLQTLDFNAARYASAVGAIADAPPGCVVVHCHAGKDRTGMVVALALTLAGAEPAAVADDYAVVGVPDVMQLVGGSGPATSPDLEAPRAETMLAVLEALRADHGGVEGFLGRAGLAADRIQALRERLRAPS
ncbi:tyrosine-protein phosphatase [Flindersiella endophytica]